MTDDEDSALCYLPPNRLEAILNCIHIDHQTRKSVQLNEDIFQDWLTFGRQISLYQRDAVKKAGTDSGTPYQDALKKLLSERLYPRYHKLSENGTLSALRWLLDPARHAEVIAWRLSLRDTKRPSHPVSLKQKWEREHPNRSE